LIAKGAPRRRGRPAACDRARTFNYGDCGADLHVWDCDPALFTPIVGKSLPKLPREFSPCVPSGNLVVAPRKMSVLDFFTEKACRLFVWSTDSSSSFRAVLNDLRVSLKSGSPNMSNGANPTYCNQAVFRKLQPMIALSFAVRAQSHVRFVECAGILPFTDGPMHIRWRAELFREEIPDIICTEEPVSVRPAAGKGGRPAAKKRARGGDSVQVTPEEAALDVLREENASLMRKVQVLEAKLTDVRLDLMAKEGARKRAQEALVRARSAWAVERTSYASFASELERAREEVPVVKDMERRALTAEAALAQQRVENARMITECNAKLVALHSQGASMVAELHREKAILMEENRSLHHRISATFFAERSLAVPVAPAADIALMRSASQSAMPPPNLSLMPAVATSSSGGLQPARDPMVLAMNATSGGFSITNQAGFLPMPVMGSTWPMPLALPFTMPQAVASAHARLSTSQATRASEASQRRSLSQAAPSAVASDPSRMQGRPSQ
jgi:hypothetical protein